MGVCVNCRRPCKSGGDRHKKGRCPIQGKHGEHHVTKLRRKRNNKKSHGIPTTRGVAVSGIHKRSASSKES